MGRPELGGHMSVTSRRRSRFPHFVGTDLTQLAVWARKFLKYFRHVGSHREGHTSYLVGSNFALPAVRGVKYWEHLWSGC